MMPMNAAVAPGSKLICGRCGLLVPFGEAHAGNDCPANWRCGVIGCALPCCNCAVCIAAKGGRADICSKCYRKTVKP